MRIVAASLAMLVVCSLPAEARPRVSNLKAAEAEARKISKAEKELKKRMRRLSASERRTLKLKRIGADSDKDGVSDILEGAIGTSRCEVDSDNDGYDDGNDSRERTAGADDGESEFEVKGAVVSFADSVIVIGSTSYTINSDTRFEGRGFSQEDIEPGVCLKVEGIATQGQQRVDKIELEDSCDGQAD